MALLQWLRRLRQQPTIKEHAGGKHSTGLRTGRPRGERDDLQAAATWQPVDSDWLSESVVSRDVTSRRHVTWRHGVIDVDATERCLRVSCRHPSTQPFNADMLLPTVHYLSVIADAAHVCTSSKTQQTIPAPELAHFGLHSKWSCSQNDFGLFWAFSRILCPCPLKVKM